MTDYHQTKGSIYTAYRYIYCYGWQRVPNPPILRRLLPLLPTPLFQILPTPPPLLPPPPFPIPPPPPPPPPTHTHTHIPNKQGNTKQGVLGCVPILPALCCLVSLTEG